MQAASAIQDLPTQEIDAADQSAASTSGTAAHAEDVAEAERYECGCNMIVAWRHLVSEGCTEAAHWPHIGQGLPPRPLQPASKRSGVAARKRPLSCSSWRWSCPATA